MSSSYDEKCEELVWEVEERTRKRYTRSADFFAGELPILHRTAKHLDLADSLEDPGAELIPGKGSYNRGQLGLDGQVFFWVGTCSYPETSLVLIWSAELEVQDLQTATEAAPWDTGGLLSRTFGRKLELDEALHLLSRYSLPVSHYRAYLSAVIETCFASPSDYVAGNAPPGWYPGWHHEMPRNCSAPSHTFELRRRGAVPITNHLVALIVDPAAFANHSSGLRGLQTFARKHSGEVIRNHYEKSVQQTALEYIQGYLNDRGVVT